MKNWTMVVLILSMLGLAACVGESEPLDYANRTWPECTDMTVIAHRLAETSQSEIQMTCPKSDAPAGTDCSKDSEHCQSVTRAVKCVFGYGILSDTTCHENN